MVVVHCSFKGVLGWVDNSCRCGGFFCTNGLTLDCGHHVAPVLPKKELSRGYFFSGSCKQMDRCQLLCFVLHVQGLGFELQCRFGVLQMLSVLRSKIQNEVKVLPKVKVLAE